MADSQPVLQTATQQEPTSSLAVISSDVTQPDASSTASPHAGAVVAVPAETARPSAEVMDLMRQAEEAGPPTETVPDDVVSPAMAPGETVGKQPADDVEHVTPATDEAQAAVAAPDSMPDTGSEPAPSASEQADATVQAADASTEATAAEQPDTVADPDVPSEVALPAEDTLLDDSTSPAAVAETGPAHEHAEAASAAAPEAVRDDDEVTERPPLDLESDNARAEAQEAAEPAEVVTTGGADWVAATGAASGVAAGAGTAATAEAAVPAVAGEATAAAEVEPIVLSLGEDAAATSAAADDRVDAVNATPVITLATSHPSAGTFAESHGSQGEDDFRDAHDEASKDVSPAGGSPAASE